MAQAEYIGAKGKIDEGIPTGFYGIDSTIEDLQPEQISILVGRNGEGKSTIISQIIANCINKKIPVFLYSGEMSTQRNLNWLFKQAIGDDRKYLDFVQAKYKLKADIKLEALQALRQWMANLFFTYDKSISNVRKSTNDLFDVMAVAVKRYGCKLVIIDNLMSAMEDNADSINADQSNFVQQCKDFAENYRTHIMLVVHPNKLKKAGEKIEKEDISGSNNIANKADTILSIEKQIKEDKDCDAKLRLLKDREEGRYKEVKLMFQESTKRLLECENGVLRHIQYDWKKYLPDKSESQWWERIEDDTEPF
jgi:twinkle protein